MIGALSQDYLDLSLVDDDGRELEIITPWKGSSNSYKDYNDSDFVSLVVLLVDAKKN